MMTNILHKYKEMKEMEACSPVLIVSSLEFLFNIRPYTNLYISENTPL